MPASKSLCRIFRRPRARQRAVG